MDHTARNELGRHIARWRTRMRISQRELARRAGLTDVARIEKGLVEPRTETLKAIAEALGIPLSDLLVAGRYDTPTPLPPLAPYLRSRYTDLSDDEVAEIHDFVDRLRQRHGQNGPSGTEDER